MRDASPQAEICYGVKASTEPALLKLLAESGRCFDGASPWEIDLRPAVGADRWRCADPVHGVFRYGGSHTPASRSGNQGPVRPQAMQFNSRNDSRGEAEGSVRTFSLDAEERRQTERPHTRCPVITIL
ncbi:hypothetical protein ACWGJW_21165 [Streptomyces nigrescens]